MKIEARMNNLEAIVSRHLEESGAIRSDLAWLKKSLWTLAGAGMSLNVALATGIILYIMNR